MKENKYDADADADADADGDVVELGDAFFEKAKSGAELAKSNPTIAKLIQAQKNGTLTVRPVGRPVSENPKKLTTVRLDAEILEFFKADGKGQQTRMNDVLREYVDSGALNTFNRP